MGAPFRGLATKHDDLRVVVAATVQVTLAGTETPDDLGAVNRVVQDDVVETDHRVRHAACSGR